MKRVFRPLISLLIVLLLISCLGVSAFAESGTVGTYLEVKLFDTHAWEANIFLYTLYTTPPGMQTELRAYDTELWLVGTPTAAGTYVCDGDVGVRRSESDSWQDQFSVTLNIADAAPKTVAVTKHPTGETVETGGITMFIARADNADSIVWQLVSPDDATVINAADAPAQFPGLDIAGLGTEALTLGNIPMSMNGWKVRALFNGLGGPVYSGSATLFVVEPPPSPTPEPTPAPSPSPSPAPTPEASPTPPAEEPPEASPAPAPGVEKDRTVAIVIGAVASVAIVCGTVIALTLIRRRR